MATYRATIESRRGVEEVFDYMADFSNVTEWDETAAEARQTAGEGPGKEARFHVLVRWLGREIPLEYSTADYARPRRVVLRAENSTTVSEDTITVEPAGTGSRMAYDAQLTLKGPLRIADPIFGLLFKRLGDRAAAGLRRALGG